MFCKSCFTWVANDIASEKTEVTRKTTVPLYFVHWGWSCCSYGYYEKLERERDRCHTGVGGSGKEGCWPQFNMCCGHWEGKNIRVLTLAFERKEQAVVRGLETAWFLPTCIWSGVLFWHGGRGIGSLGAFGICRAASWAHVSQWPHAHGGRGQGHVFSGSTQLRRRAETTSL